MPKMIVSIDGVVIKEVQLTKDRTTLGRRPYNDIVIDNLAVSGEHAVMQMSGADVFLEDLNSTNGTYVNGKAIKKQQLQNGDTVEIGKYKIKFFHEGASDQQEKTTVINSGAVVTSEPSTVGEASIRVMSGAAAGREVPLVRDYLDGEGIPLKAKFYSIGLMWPSILFSCYLVPHLYARAFMLTSAVLVTLYIVRQKTLVRR